MKADQIIINLTRLLLVGSSALAVGCSYPSSGSGDRATTGQAAPLPVNAAPQGRVPLMPLQSKTGEDEVGLVSPRVLTITKDAEVELLEVAATRESGVASDSRSTDVRASGKSLKLKAETEVTIVRKIEGQPIGEVVEIRIDSDDSSVPSEALVRMDDLEKVSMPADSAVTPLDAEVSSEDDADEVLVENARRRGGTPSCYRDVKFELLRRHLVGSYPPGAAAWMGFDVLSRQFGFQPVAFSQNLPNGAVCVSEGGRFGCGRHKCGHIAVKIGAYRWYGAGVFPNPLLRGHYRLRCLVK